MLDQQHFQRKLSVGDNNPPSSWNRWRRGRRRLPGQPRRQARRGGVRALSGSASRAGPSVLCSAGAGAAGTLTALHLVRTSLRRSTPLELLLLDPADRWGRGVAFGTPEDQHLLNVTATGARGAGWVTAWACDREPPATSNLNLDHVGQTVANLVVTTVGPSGEVCLASSIGTHLVADLAG